MSMDNAQWSVAGVVTLFVALVVTTLFLAVRKVIGFELATLMLVGLLGMYVGFGVLVAVWRFVDKLK